MCMHWALWIMLYCFIAVRDLGCLTVIQNLLSKAAYYNLVWQVRSFNQVGYGGKLNMLKMESLYCAGLDDLWSVFTRYWLPLRWFLVIWFDIMPSCIPRNLHECTCRGSGGARNGWSRIPCLRRCRSRLCHLPTKDRQAPRRQALWPAAGHGAHAHEPCVYEASRYQTCATGTNLPDEKCMMRNNKHTHTHAPTHFHISPK